ncbi:MAG: c-type cytochrome [Saprospiraceae bacterium]
MQDENKIEKHSLQTILILWKIILLLLLVVMLLTGFLFYNLSKGQSNTAGVVVAAEKISKPTATEFWQAPTEIELSNNPNSELLRYGRELIVHTAAFLGPKGKVAQITNGMNCQNCHLAAGTKPFGNNYGSVASTYPKYRARSGQIENIYKRVTDCFERSLNGNAPDSSSREMQAISSYINWLGKDVEKKSKAKGSGIYELPYLARAASPEKGKALYEHKCSSCHRSDGSGILNTAQNEYTYPPLWGEHSFNTAAGLYRLSRFAGYIKINMPIGATYDNQLLSEEEAWDIAAFVISMPRPQKTVKADWPKIEEKPIDHPFGPFSDPFNENQHKYGPFPPIANAHPKKS